jgi:hypothetical protein
MRSILAAYSTTLLFCTSAGAVPGAATAPSLTASAAPTAVYRVQIAEDPAAAKTADERWEREQTHDQADLVAQQISAVAADRQVWIASGAAILSFIALIVAIRSSRSTARAYEQIERAWVGVSNIGFRMNGELDAQGNIVRVREVHVHPTVQNFGSSPALECKVWSDLKFLDRPERRAPPEFLVPDDAEAQRHGAAPPLMPGGEMYPSNQVIPMDHIVRMLDNTTLLAYVYVRIEYKDALRRERRLTESCHEVVVLDWLADRRALDQPRKAELRCRQVGRQNQAT